MTATPNPDRPRLRPELEAQLLPADQKSAEGYARVEEAIAALEELRADGAVVIEIEPSDTQVHRLTVAVGERKPDGGT